MVIEVRRETENAVRAKVERGEYEDADALIQAALRSLEFDERRALVAAGFAQIERGEFAILTPELMDKIEQEADELARSGVPLAPHVLP